LPPKKNGRVGYRCELDPIYCDRIITRWEAIAKDEAEQVVCGWVPNSTMALEAAK